MLQTILSEDELATRWLDSSTKRSLHKENKEIKVSSETPSLLIFTLPVECLSAKPYLLPKSKTAIGGLAQMVERLFSVQEAKGSIPLSSIFILLLICKEVSIKMLSVVFVFRLSMICRAE